MMTLALLLLCVVQVAGKRWAGDQSSDYSNVNGRFQPSVVPGADSEYYSYLGSFSEVAQCEAAALAKEDCHSYTYFSPSAVNATLHTSCYCVTKDFWYWFPANAIGVTSARVWSGCKDSSDCAYNGECDTDAGTCQCYQGWKGMACSVLFELEAPRNSGYQPAPDGVNTSSWGGPIQQDPTTGTYHMWPSQMLGHCGLNTWASNSQIMHATSPNPLGPYEWQNVVFDSFSHEPDVKITPDGKLTMFMTQRVPNQWPICTCKNGSSVTTCDYYPAHPDKDHTTMSSATSFEGPWTAPIEVMHNTTSDSNLSPWFVGGSAMVGLWRTFYHNTTNTGYSRIHWMSASNYSDAGTYTYTTQLSSDLYNLGGPTEDPFLYKDPRSVYHALFHNMYGCFPCGGHAFSKDGLTWTYTGGDAYGDMLNFTGASVLTRINRRERPHILFDKDGEISYLSTGVVPGWNADYSFTSVVPLGKQ